jgi:hypothetical protein
MQRSSDLTEKKIREIVDDSGTSLIRMNRMSNDKRCYACMFFLTAERQRNFGSSHHWLSLSNNQNKVLDTKLFLLLKVQKKSFDHILI